MCLENVKGSVGGRYGGEGIPRLPPMLFTHGKRSNVLLLNTLVLQGYELNVKLIHEPLHLRLSHY